LSSSDGSPRRVHQNGRSAGKQQNHTARMPGSKNPRKRKKKRGLEGDGWYVEGNWGTPVLGCQGLKWVKQRIACVGRAALKKKGSLGRLSPEVATHQAKRVGREILLLAGGHGTASVEKVLTRFWTGGKEKIKLL